MNSFRNILKQLRDEKNISSYKLADILHVSRSCITNYERGIRTPDYELLVEIANFFNVSIDYLLGRTSDRRTADQILEEYSVICDVKNLDKNQKDFIINFIKTYLKQ